MTNAALVLAGGGRVGIAWELGFLRGIELAAPELIARIRAPETTYVGTSAGSIVSAELALGASLEQLLEAELVETAPNPDEKQFRLLPMVASMIKARVGARSPEDARRRIGAYASRAETMPEEAWVEGIGARFPSGAWPDRRLLINTVDVDSGEHRVFDSSSGVDLVRAVAASCAVPGIYPPVTIDGRRYMDGGMRSIANVDVATGCDPVLVVAPLRGGAGLGTISATELAALGEARVHVVYADREAARAFGRNPLDGSTRGASAQAGLRQGTALAAELEGFWP